MPLLLSELGGLSEVRSPRRRRGLGSKKKAHLGTGALMLFGSFLAASLQCFKTQTGSHRLRAEVVSKLFPMAHTYGKSNRLTPTT